MSNFALERALYYWPSVVSLELSGWRGDFARSIAARARRKGWKPSPKQWAIMEAMVAEVAPTDDDIEVIE